jgi:2-keto-myo-inositol isomerase
MGAPFAPRFALNHMVAPRLGLTDFFHLAATLGIAEVEIRNDLPGRAIADGTSPDAVRAGAAEAGVTIVSINALQRFDDWTAAREREAVALAGYAAACGARALVLVPVNEAPPGAGPGPSRRHRLEEALEGLLPILAGCDLLGLIEPLGFTTCSLRSKRVAVEAIESVGGGATFRLVHDTFHHAVAGEPALYPALTGLVHLSGVTDPAIPLADLRDAHRVLVDDGDRLGSVDQVAALTAAGYGGPLSFEPFAVQIHGLADPRAAIAASMALVTARLTNRAA